MVRAGKSVFLREFMYQITIKENHHETDFRA